MPLLALSARGSKIVRLNLVQRVELEVIGQLVHALHLLLPIHLEPLLNVDAQVLALLLEAHLGPLEQVEALRTRRMLSIARVDSDLVAPTPDLVAHFGARNAMLDRITAMAMSQVVVIVDLVVVLTAEGLTALHGLLPTPLPDLLLRHLVKALLVRRWRLNDALE